MGNIAHEKVHFRSKNKIISGNGESYLFIFLRIKRK